jgi:hypothetical protein
MNGNKKKKEDKSNRCKGTNENKIKKFNLEHSVACGALRVDLIGRIDMENIKLSDVHQDYLVHIEYSPEDKKYRFSAYRKKE